MTATSLRSRGARRVCAVALPCALFAGCGAPGPALPGAELATEPVEPVEPSTPDPADDLALFEPRDPEPCDPSISVPSDGPALVVTDPNILEPFQLERVLAQILARAGETEMTPRELLQRLFDTENTTAGAVFPDNVHCDSPENRAFTNAAPVDCPRAEGALARSPDLFTPGRPDYFAPVALVNRFDLATTAMDTCGEYRMIYAKQSGRDDPDDRVFLIFEGALSNPTPGDIMTCSSPAALWASLEGQDPATITASLEAFYFDGLPGFAPLVDPNHFGLLSSDDGAYGSQRGQVRLSQRMQEPWEMRELRLTTPGKSELPRLLFAPTTVKNNPAPALYDPGSTEPTDAALLFVEAFRTNVPLLAAARVPGIRMEVPSRVNAGESAVSGGATTDYAALLARDTSLLDQLEEEIARARPDLSCPPDDPLTAESILKRASVQSCAGCHAPEQFLGPERKIGCGLEWPGTLGEVHIDERGALSPALTEVFLPHRAKVMTTFLQACDAAAIQENLLPVASDTLLPI
ncbi:uncharacterized protein SOCE26_025950 [Sorangium cellulosum]|uniref:Cytochrome c domain-containing protein n=1 Tax=Sorangium cellulosum TaxID=56 RepID=A0A2L0EPI9_SORCE|nr:hypothetical protein [Sorangium cellulosum]AUX41185.1 uncharacterized protein SOCE26_025950 [Sorangium cellulosum]